jgi:uncharacterized membrane protein YeaQ/YmgE (transglycosylase-associated protein family)
MSIIAWIILGLVLGFIASQIVQHRGASLLLDLLLGIIGAIVGGWLFSVYGAHDTTNFNPFSLLVSALGAVVPLLIYYALTAARPASRF